MIILQCFSATVAIHSSSPRNQGDPVHHQIHNAAYNMGYAFGWLLIISPLLLLAWLALRLTR